MVVLRIFSGNLPQNLNRVPSVIPKTPATMITTDSVDASRNRSNVQTVRNPSIRLCDSEHKNLRCPLLHRKNTQPTYHWTIRSKRSPSGNDAGPARDPGTGYGGAAPGGDGHGAVPMPVAHCGCNPQFFEVSAVKRVKGVCLPG